MAKKSSVMAKAVAPGAGTSTPSKSTPVTAAAAVQAQQPLMNVLMPPNIGVAPVAPKTRQRRKINRREFSFAVFVGSSIAPKAWCKSREEVAAFIQTVPSKKLDAIDVAALTPVKTKVEVNF